MKFNLEPFREIIITLIALAILAIYPIIEKKINKKRKEKKDE